MRTLLICHHDAALDRDGLARWLASFSTLAGVVVITETGDTVKRRVQREWKRSGWLRFADILAFRIYYKLFLAGSDAAWARAQCASLAGRFPPHAAPVLDTATMTTPSDADGDGHARVACGGDDCDDNDPTIYTGAPELCDGKDNDCNNVIDDGAMKPRGATFGAPASFSVTKQEYKGAVAPFQQGWHLVFGVFR